MEFAEETGFTDMPITLNSEDLTTVKSLLLWLTLFSTIILYPLVIIRYHLMIIWLKSKRMISCKASLSSTGSIYYLLAELMIYSLIPTPFYSTYTFTTFNEQTNLETVYTFNEFFSLLVLLRVVMVFRILLGNSRYYTNSAHRICRLTGCNNGYLFVIKGLMKNNPFEVLFAALFLSLITFAYALKVCERPLIYALSQKTKQDPVGNDVSNYYNSLWVTIVTMTTVGYGDFFPRTIPGRAIAFFSCMIGVVVVSLMTIIISNFIEMSHSETRSYTIIEKIAVEKEKRVHAAYMITNLSKLGFFKGFIDKNKEKKTLKSIMEKFKKHLYSFQALRRERMGIFASNTTEEEISRHFTFLNADHKNLEEKINILCEKNLMILDRLGCLDEEEIKDSEDSIPSAQIYTPLIKRQRYKSMCKANSELHANNKEFF